MSETHHHDPAGRRDYLSIQHLERYRFALERLEKSMRVLDIACGAGYGTAMLLARGCDVTGVDCDEPTLAAARRQWGEQHFLQGDALSLPLDDESFDAVVTFETIEHVADGDAFLTEMKRVLRPGGLLLCSTPNIRYTSHPAMHIKEYRPDEFYTLLERHFEQVERLGQYICRRDWLKKAAMDNLWQPSYRVARRVMDVLGVGRRSNSAAVAQGPPSPPAGPEDGTVSLADDPRVKRLVTRQEGDDFYAVGPLHGQRWLRIMVAAGVKGERA
jgi:SAM-dependent methyltransferase